MVNQKKKFKPAYGTEAKILNLPYQEGFIYFATDVGKIYLDLNNKRQLMSAIKNSAGVVLFYGNDYEPTQIQDADSDLLYTLKLTTIEDYALLSVNDLILNIDGCFYRVLEINSNTNTVKVIQLSISGSGGEGDGPIGNKDISLKWDVNTIDSNFIFIYKADTIATFTPFSETDNTVNMTFDIYVKDDNNTDKLYSSFTEYRITSGSNYNFDTSKLPLGKNITLKVTIYAANSSMPNQSRTYTFPNLSTIEIGIKKGRVSNSIPLVLNRDGGHLTTLTYSVLGEANSGINEYINILVDGELQGSPILVSPNDYGRSINATIGKQSHGAHNIEMYVTAEVNGQTVRTNSIYYEGAWVEDDNRTPIILIGNYDPVVVNYENSYIEYTVYDPNAQASGTSTLVQIYRGTNLLSDIDLNYSSTEWFLLDISEIYEVGDNLFSISCKSERKDIEIFVTEEGSRDLSLAQKNTLALNYSAAGRSNLEIKSNRKEWSALKAIDGYPNNATLQNFNWRNNGWQNDGKEVDGIDNGAYLSITNNASVIIPAPFLSLNGNKSYTIEARFRVRNVAKYSTLIQTMPTYFYVDENGEKSTTGALASEIDANENWSYFEDEWGNKVIDNENPKNIYQTTEGVICKWMNESNYGFCLGSQEAYFRTSEGIVNVRYKEDEVINISFVVDINDKMLYIYLNGILSGANKLPRNEFEINSNFEFNSNYCDIDLYRFRIYETGLTMPEVIHNYLSDIHNIALYDQNQLTDNLIPTFLDYNLLVKYNENHLDAPTMPYAVWKILDQGRSEKLPYYKGDKCKVEVTFVNPSLDRALETGEIDEWYYYTHCPSFKCTGDLDTGAAQIDVQGTSSQGYPRRNYKIKYKNAGDKWIYVKGSLANQPLTKSYMIKDKDGVEHELTEKYHMDNLSLGTGDFTWKIDYMESSGTYNTGFANMMGNKKQPLYSKHPLEDLSLNIDTNDYRTTVYGFPVLTFHQYESASNNPSNKESFYLYEYIGRYNMNLDKGSNEYYGYELEEPHPYVENKTIADIAECWELSDNQGTWCSWRYPNDEARAQGFGTLQADTTDKLEVMQHFEYRYSPYEDQLDAIGADGKYDGSTDDIDIIKEIGGENATTWGEVPNAKKSEYARDKYSNLEILFNWLDSTDQMSATNTPLKNDEGVETPVEYETLKDYTSAYIYKSVDINSEYSSSTTYYILNDDKQTYTEFQKINFGLDENGIPNIETEESFLSRFNMYKENEEIFTREVDPASDTISVKKALSGLYTTTFKSDTANYRIEKFRAEFSEHLDMEYCLVYFIMTELLLCYDSRGKNMMMASFGPIKEGGNYIWYPIFYDIDTQLGINNSGAALWDYDADVTKDKIFSTATSVLWNNLFSAYEEEIKNRYRILRGANSSSQVNGKLTYEAITGAYACNSEVFDSYAMKGIRPIIAIGLDEHYKYFAIKTDGYFDTKGNLIKDTSLSYAYACQGDKQLTTELLLRNRLNYIDSWLQGGDYYYNKVKQGQLMLRVSGNNSNTSDKYLDVTQDLLQEGYVYGQYPVPYYDARPGFKLKPFLKQYVTYFVDEIAAPPVKYEDNELQRDGVWTATDTNILDGFKTQANTPSQQLNYIPGVDYLSSLGDLSVSYPNEFSLIAGKKLTDLNLGSDAPGYRNNLMKSDKFALEDGKESSTPKTLLKKILLNGITSLASSIDVAGSQKLEEFRALNTSIQNVIFAEGAPLHTVHLPNTVNELVLKANNELTSILTETPKAMEEIDGKIITHEPDTYRGLYIEGLTDYKNNSNPTGHTISRIEIEGPGLGYNSYTLLHNLYNIKNGAESNNSAKIGLKEVSWTPYEVVAHGEAPAEGVDYFKLTDHSTYVNYSPDITTPEGIEEFNSYTLNELIYTKNENKNSAIIPSLELFDKLISQYLLAKQNNKPSQFANLTASSKASVPTITGDLFIDNLDGDAIKEDEFTNKYKVHFPNLNITAANVIKAYITKYVQVLDSGKENVVEILRSLDTTPQAPIGQVPTKANYDFKGWSLIKNGAEDDIVIHYNLEDKTYVNLEEQLSILQDNMLNAEDQILTFYAVFTIHSYKNVFMNGSTEIETLYIPWGQKLREPKNIPWRGKDAESSLNLTERYGFKGYSTTQNSNNIVKIEDMTSIQDRIFYAQFELESVYDSTINPKYLIFTDIGNSYEVAANPDYVLSGKITLPTSYDNKPISGIADGGFLKFVTFNTKQDLEMDNGIPSDNITHIFWEEGMNSTNVIRIGKNGFKFQINNDYDNKDANPKYCSLIYCELPNSITTIDEYAFAQQQKLTLTELPKALTSLGRNAFSACSSLEITYIGNQLAIIPEYAFSQVLGKREILEIGDSVQEIGNYAFGGYPGYGLISTIIIGSGIRTIAHDAFEDQNDEDPEISTIKKIVISRPSNTVSGNPWGANFATIEWVG